MGIFGDSKGRKGGKKNRKSKPVVKTRKELRKDKRKQKKNNRAEYYQKKNQPAGKYVVNPDQGKRTEKEKKPVPRTEDKAGKKNKKLNRDPEKRKHDLEVKRQLRLEKDMEKNRKVQLKEANIAEDKIIKQLEKNLKLNKRKSKSIPKSFETDGLNYVLEMCDDENRQLAVETERRLLAAENESGSEFEDDFNMVTETRIKGQKKTISESSDLDDDNDFDDLVDSEEDSSSDDYGDGEEEELPSRHKTEDQSRSKKRKTDAEDEGSSSPRKKVSTKIESRDIESEDSEYDDDDLVDEDMLAESEDEENSDGPEDGETLHFKLLQDGNRPGNPRKPGIVNVGHGKIISIFKSQLFVPIRMKFMDNPDELELNN